VGVHVERRVYSTHIEISCSARPFARWVESGGRESVFVSDLSARDFTM